MGYETPSIDRIAREDIRLQHYYGEQSCTASRAAFLTGQHGIRTGLTKVGFPGAPMGMSQIDPSIGGLLKNLGYATGQFGRNYGAMDEVFKFAGTFKAYPPRSVPPSFNPATILEETLREINVEQKLDQVFPMPGGRGSAAPAGCRCGLVRRKQHARAVTVRAPTKTKSPAIALRVIRRGISGRRIRARTRSESSA